MAKLYFFIFLLLVTTAVIALKWSHIFFALAISQIPLWIILIINAERINIFSTKRLGLWPAARGHSLAMLGSLILPGRVTELLKPLYYKSNQGLPISDGTVTVVLERIFDLLAAIILMLLMMYILPLENPDQAKLMQNFVLLASMALAGFFIVVFLRPGWIKAGINLIPDQKLNHWLQTTFDQLQSGLKAGFHPWQVLLTLTVWLGAWASYWVFLQYDGGITLNWGQALVIFIVGTLGITITITPGGLGTFEAAVSFALTNYGYDWDQALISAVGLRVAALLPSAIVAIYTIFIEGFDFAKARSELSITNTTNNND